MANPFSGLENIGASYMAGARLAQERQRRADEIVARQEEARVRQQYYQDIIAEREAARLATAGEREAQGATQFGKYLVRKPDGTIDYQASQAAKQVGEEEGQLGAAYGALAARGEDIGPISPRIMQTPQFMAARAAGIDRRAAEAKAIKDSMLRAGYFPVSEKPVPAFGFSTDLLRQPEDTSQDVMIDGARFRPTPVTQFKMQPKAKPENLGYETIDLPDGGKARIPITPERSAAIAAARATTTPKEPGLFDDIDAAEKQLLTLQDKNVEDLNLVRNKDGNLEVVEDTAFAIGRTPEQIQADLALERKRRAERRGIRTGAAAPSAIPQGTNRVIDFRSIQGLPPLPGR
jgi:hypothetical protein